MADSPPTRCDLAVVGAGIIGLAVAREWTRRHPRASVCVFEREQQPATHQTGHSSGVIHSGVYYRPGSLKARLCVQGAQELYDYCEQRSIAHERCGKLILATDERQLAALDRAARRGEANGVERLAPAARRGDRARRATRARRRRAALAADGHRRLRRRRARLRR